MFTKARKMLYRARGYYNGALNGEPFRLDPYHSKFWRKTTAGQWEPETFAVLDQNLSPDRDYVDIGAWTGPTVLYASRRARHVWCFEPDPVAYRHLIWNLELNNIRNVSAFGVALWKDTGIVRMASLGGEAGDSMTSVLGDPEQGTDVISLSWDQFTQSVDLSGVSLVKMDVEGAEFSLLPTLLPWLRAQRPALYLSTHAPFLDEQNRPEAMRALGESLEFYSHCQSEEVTGPIAQAFQTPRALGQFPSFLLKG
ncbi:FkbM family methyltransferase [Ruegeria sp. 2205SS24-7]|uniref:FkbM family methyltransferase n=1 Tax=Ruegeria discodermiae TaxID=3064389 RepID=UPI00274145EF|nr:FkbM family methyltransferase [Ruegeria sp. 2205SS24-7]MDP5219427.1 FkbM family methyltransferase [Ruegeria sp. 2205SS24-7]